MTELTNEKLNELEALAKAAQEREAAGIKGGVTVLPEVALSLIAAARELETLRSALAHLSDCNFCLDSPDYRSTLDPGDIVESALMSGWEPTNGR